MAAVGSAHAPSETAAQPAHPAQVAALRLETLGTSVDGATFVRAVASRHQPLIDLFLSAGIDVNLSDSEGCSALLVAAMAQDWELMKRLLKSGADPRLADKHGRTALMACAMHQQQPLFRDLLELGANPRASDAVGHTALHYAVAGKSHSIAKELLPLAEDVSAVCCEDRSLLGHALDTGDWSLIEPILSRHPATLPWNSQSRALLAQALNAREMPKVRLLLAKHPAAPTPEGHAQPLLAYAVAHGDVSLLKSLLECGADADTPLSTPTDKHFLDLIPENIVRHYLADEPGMNILMLAAGLGRADMVKLLLEKGASRTTSTRSKHKLVPIYFAAWAQSPEAIQLLLGNAPSPDKLRIEISLGDQRAHLIKNNVPVLSTDVSTGRAGFSTPQGRFVVTDKHSSHISSIYKVKMPLFMRLNCRDFGMHQGHLPGYPASHGCIRVPSDMARKLFQEVPIGTLVTIR